jgi:hypothetical protein
MVLVSRIVRHFRVALLRHEYFKSVFVDHGDDILESHEMVVDTVPVFVETTAEQFKRLRVEPLRDKTFQINMPFVSRWNITRRPHHLDHLFGLILPITSFLSPRLSSPTVNAKPLNVWLQLYEPAAITQFWTRRFVLHL